MSTGRPPPAPSRNQQTNERHMNNILALIIIVVTFTVMYSKKPSMSMLVGALAIIGGITGAVAIGAASGGEYGPIMGVGAFVITLGGFFLYNSFKKKD